MYTEYDLPNVKGYVPVFLLFHHENRKTNTAGMPHLLAGWLKTNNIRVKWHISHTNIYMCVCMCETMDTGSD